MARNDGRVEKGQSIGSAFSAKAWNRAQDAADVVLGVGPSLEAGQVQGPPLTCLTVLVRNNSTQDIPVGGWLSLRYTKIDGIYNFVGNEIVINEPVRTENVKPVFIGNSYVAGAADAGGIGEYEIAVAVEPIKQGALGRCAFEGIAPARIAVTGPYGDPLTDEGIVTDPPGGAGNNFFPGPWYGEVPWHAVPYQGQTSCLVPVNNNQSGARPIRILWIENNIATGPTGVTGPAYRNGLVRLHGADSSFIKHVRCTGPDLPHANQLRPGQAAYVNGVSTVTGVACDYTGIPIVRYSYTATGVSTGPEVVQFLNFLRPHTQIGPSGVYLTVAQARQHPNRAAGTLGYPQYWAVSSDQPVARQVYYNHGQQSDWHPGESRTVTFYDLGFNGGTQSFSGTVFNLFGIITTSFDGLAVADAFGKWCLVCAPFSVFKEYKDLNDRIAELESANLPARVTALENA